MNLRKTLEVIIKESKKFKICDSLILFGSAQYSESPKDIDLSFYKKSAPNKNDYINFIHFLDYLNEKYEYLNCTFASGKGRKNRGIEINCLLHFNELFEFEPFFVYELSKNSTCLYGKSPYIVNEAPLKQLVYCEVDRLMKHNVLTNYHKAKAMLRVVLLSNGIRSTKKENLLQEFESLEEIQFSVEEHVKFLKGDVENKLLDQLSKHIYSRYNFLTKKRILCSENIQNHYQINVILRRKFQRNTMEDIANYINGLYL